ncbi:MAG: flagellar hook assembly protein FlgD [Deltaproteobacteria bacterium]|nr:flagellar hook assembly protein FlgD [Deltaproteobacteria bacterium]
MKIEGLSLPAPGSEAEPATKTPKDEFLRLLVAQLQHQDPLQPQEGAEFVAQLAQLASLEQSAETNQRLASLDATQSAVLRASYSSLVGRTVSARIDQVEVPEVTSGATLFAHVDGAASEAHVRITDENGREVRRIALGPIRGDAAFQWDGRGEGGVALPPGSYRIEIEAKSAEGSAVSAYAGARGVVQAVELGDGGIHFSLGGINVMPGDILAIEDSAPHAAAVEERNNEHVDLELSDYRLEWPWSLRTGHWPRR